MNLKQNNEGVSPVIGVILMVAITVVLAAGVYILVDGIADRDINKQVILGVSDEGDGLLVITQAPRDMLWSDLIVSGCNNANQPTADVLAGDELTNCASGATISHRATNQLLYRVD